MVSSSQVTATELAEKFAALASDHRLRIIAELVDQEVHVSELARRMGMSRALLYMHLKKLEAAGFVSSQHFLGEDGKAINIFSLTPFSMTIKPAVIANAVAASAINEEKEV